MSKLQLIYTRGYPGSGKSTYAKNLQKSYPGKLERVNRDDLRKLQEGYKRGKFNRTIERKVRDLRDSKMRSALSNNISVINDDTNLGEVNIKLFREMANHYKAELVCVDFTDPSSKHYVSVEECIKRDLLRDDSVGKDVILRMFYEFEVKQAPKPIVQVGLPMAYIFDIDGTLADYGDLRSPFEEKYEVDLPVKPLIRILEALHKADFRIIVLSGREATIIGRMKTEKWLDDHIGMQNIDRFYMRDSGDSREDSIIKREIYQQHIKGKFNVLGVFDDRKRVCRMWELQGLTVFRCGPEYDFDIAK